MNAQATQLKPNPLYGWDATTHNVTVTLDQQVTRGVAVYQVHDNGVHVGFVHSRPVSASGPREWDYAVPGSNGRLTYPFRSRHDAVLHLLEKVAR